MVAKVRSFDLLKKRFNRLGIEFSAEDISSQLKELHQLDAGTLFPHQRNPEKPLVSGNIDWSPDLDSRQNVENFSYLVQVTKALSLNNMYLTGQNGRKVWTYLNPKIQLTKTEIIEGLNKLGIKQDFEKYKGNKEIVMEVHFKFIFRENFWTRDVDNLVKYTSDAFTEASGVDDRRTLKMSQEKIINDVDWREFIQIEVKVYSNQKRATGYLSERLEGYEREETFSG